MIQSTHKWITLGYLVIIQNQNWAHLTRKKSWVHTTFTHRMTSTLSIALLFMLDSLHLEEPQFTVQQCFKLWHRESQASRT